MMHRKISWISFLLLTMLFLSDVAFGQATVSSATGSSSTTIPVRKKRIKPIRTELSLGIRFNTDGWTVFLDKGWVKNLGRPKDLFYDVKLLQVEFSEKKHPKEIKRSNNLGTFTSEQAKPFIFGKLNNFYTFKVGYGKRKLIAGKPVAKTVSIHWVYLAGISVGLQKPYYVEAYIDRDQTGVFTQETIKYEEETKSAFLSRQNIVGSAGFSQGIGETKIVPGAHAKTAVHFDFAASKKVKLAIEAGVNAEIYTSSIPLMANQNDVPYFVNMYVSLQFGKRWQ